MIGLREPFRPSITHTGQRYYHRAVVFMPKKLVNAVCKALNLKPYPSIRAGYRRVDLVWKNGEPHERIT